MIEPVVEDAGFELVDVTLARRQTAVVAARDRSTPPPAGRPGAGRSLRGRLAGDRDPARRCRCDRERLSARGLVARGSTGCSHARRISRGSCGSEVSIETRRPLEGRKRFRGRLVAFEGGLARCRRGRARGRDPVLRGRQGQGDLRVHLGRFRGRRARALTARADRRGFVMAMLWKSEARDRSDRQGQGHRSGEIIGARRGDEAGRPARARPGDGDRGPSTKSSARSSSSSSARWSRRAGRLAVRSPSSEAREFDPDAESRRRDRREARHRGFGRILAQTAKQVIIQRIREAERDTVFDEYKDRKGEIVNGIVRRFEKGAIIVDLGRAEAVLPLKEQVPRENYRPNDRVRAYVVDVNKAPRARRSCSRAPASRCSRSSSSRKCRRCTRGS